MSSALDAAFRSSLMLLFILTTVLVLTWLERKILARIQMRMGPMRTAPFQMHGVLQAPADAVKLLVKEDLTPAAADRWVYQMAPYLVFVPGFLVLVSLPFTRELLIRNLDLGLFYIVAISPLSIIGLILAGWGSGNKYALLGGVRSAAQLVSYEIPLLLSVLGVVMLTGSLNLGVIVEGQRALPFLFLQPLGFLLFLTAGLAELNRSPFDIPTAESELVGGPFIEYSGMRWGIFYLAEYGNIFIISALSTVLYLGGWIWPYLPPAEWLGGWGERLVAAGWFLIKSYAVILIIFWLRGTLPRLRVDQLMTFSWKFLLPLAFLNVLLTAIYLIYGWLALLASLVISLAIVIPLYTRGVKVL